MEADRTQTVFLQQLRELLGNVVGTDDVPNLVHTQIAEIIPIVAFTAQAAVGVLLTFQHQQTVTDGRHKGQRPQAGLRFCTISLHQNLFAVDGCLRDDVLDIRRSLRRKYGRVYLRFELALRSRQLPPEKFLMSSV